MSEEEKQQDIAIIGMACRYPGAPTIRAFWDNLCRGGESLTFFSDEELLADGADPSSIRDPAYVKAGTVLPDYDRFDAAFFGFTPREAEILDPKHRIMLECAWEALEDAGYTSAGYGGKVGVYAGGGADSYLINNLLPNPELVESAGLFQILLDNSNTFLATRLSYKLNLTGPSIGIETACSTSLVAVHLACQGLLSGDCGMALAGGISVRVPHKQGYLHQSGMIHSPDGHTRTFSDQAQGTTGGNGAGIVVLKRMSEALADGDTIYAVIKGSAVNNDGALKVSYTAPSVDGQAQVIRDAQAVAGVDPGTIGYVEAHGTATTLGDPIEIAALTQAFETKRTAFCAIGSVKTNIGHADAAAGVAGLIKTSLALKHGVIPPSLHFDQPNPAIDFAHSPFYVNVKLSEFPTTGTPRRAGVSSFGVGGTNAHIILEEPPAREMARPCRHWQALLLSAKTPAALDQATADLASYFEEHPDVQLADAAYTLAVGRERHSHHRIVVCQSVADAGHRLRRFEPANEAAAKIPESSQRPVAYMFPGQGAQYPGMGRELYESEPVFRQQVDRCSEILAPLLGLDLRSVLYPGANAVEEAAYQLEQTAYMQPAIFVVAYATAQLWRAWGVTPQAMIGHSLGEYVAATLAGVFSLEDALALVAVRGRLIQSTSEGAMLAVSLPEAEAIRRLRSTQAHGPIALAAVNGPVRCVVSGGLDAIRAFERQLTAESIPCRRLRVRVANHSQLVEPIVEEFTSRVRATAMRCPEIPFISNVTGDWITDEMATDPGYWARHLRQTVRFADGIRTLLQEPDLIFLEVGPGNTLSTLVEQQGSVTDPVAINSLRHSQDPQSDGACILTALGRVWMAGGAVDWNGFYAGQRRHRIALPAYPFERLRYWIDPPKRTDARNTIEAAGKHQAITEWLYAPSWERSVVPLKRESTEGDPTQWLLFIDECGLGVELAKRLAANGDTVTTVRSGSRLVRLSGGSYVLNPACPADYVSVLEQLAGEGNCPRRIVHLWRVTSASVGLKQAEIDAGFDRGFYSLVYLAQALESTSSRQTAAEVQLTVITNEMQEVTGEECLCPEKATILGPVKVISQELPNIRCRSIDLRWEQQDPSNPLVIDQLLAELRLEMDSASAALPQAVAYRGRHRWEQIFKRLEAGQPPSATLFAGGLLRRGGVYLITGGLGGVGLALAEALAALQVKLVLIGRSAFPERPAWSGWLASHDDLDLTSRRIRKVQEIERRGAKVLVIQSDVADREQMQAALQQAERVFGPLNGAIHAAGITNESSRPLSAITPEECAYQLRPKVNGVLVLHELLQGKPIDFCILLSSLASVLGGLGMVAYSAANLFMDAFALLRNRTGSTRWMSVNLDGWVTDAGGRLAPTGVGASLASLAMTNQEAIGVFDLLTRSFNGAQVAVSTASLPARIAQWCTSQPRPAAIPEGKQTAHASAANGLEQSIAAIWQELLGIGKIARTDDFWQLGGDSLLGMQLISRVRRNFHVALKLEDLFQQPTVSGLASYIEAAQGASHRRPDPIEAESEVEVEEGVL